MSTGSLPVQLTSFVGRDREIAAVCDLVRSSRLLTLTGPGGSGKTRLALEVAARLAPVDTAWIDLTSVRDGALVPHAAVAALGMREEGTRAPLEVLADRLHGLDILLLLDNCEHVVDACAGLVEAILRACPAVRVLATSREALGVSGEQAWLVPPLVLPEAGAAADGATLVGSEAGRLFLERARAVLPAFSIDSGNAAAIAQICRRLDGIPLAIELAAARVRVLAPEQIAARLDDAFRLLATPGRISVPRHRTLREAVDWSHALLTEPEAALFRRLSIFAGSFSLDAVEAVCRDPVLPGDDILELLSMLVDKSLVVMEPVSGEARYRLLETLRQYAREKLKSAGEDASLHERHALFFVQMARQAERPTFGGASHAGWTRRLAADEPNFRAAADWAEESPARADVALSLVAALHWHWFACGNFREGRRRFEVALEHSSHATPLTLGKALVAYATFLFWTGELATIADTAARGVALLRKEHDTWWLAYGLTTAGVGAALADPSTGTRHLEEAVDTARTHGKTVLLTFALYWKGRVARSLGQLEAAAATLNECLALGREIDQRPAIAHTLTVLGGLDLERGDLAAAGTHLLESVRLHSESGDVLGTIWTMESLFQLHMAQSRLERAIRLLSVVRAERERIGAAWSRPEQVQFDELIATAREQLGNYVFAIAWDRGRNTPLGAAVELELAGDPADVRCDPVSAAASPSGPGPATPVARAGGSLEVLALGPLRITVDARPLEREAWNSGKPRELLLFLLAHPHGCTREQVGVAFWPEASTEQVRNSFHVTLHRLRKTLGGAQWIQLVDERYLVNPEASIEFDAARFELEITRAKDGNVEGALALYRGDFLEHENAGDWHLELRDRLRRLYLDTLMGLGESQLKRQEWRQAADVFRRVIARDEIHEAAYRSLMTCHARLGERSEAFRLFQRLERLLKQEMDADPDPATAALLASLQTADQL